MGITRIILAFLLCALFSVSDGESQSYTKQPPSALEARALALGFVRKELRENIVEISSPHEVDSLAPNRWNVKFWDPLTENVEIIQVEGGRATSLSETYEANHMDHGLVSEYSMRDIMDPIYLQIDSPKAFQIAKQLEEVNEISVSSVEYRLQKEEGSAQVIWTLILYKEIKGVEIEALKVKLSADSGEVIQVDPYKTE
jgi:hypothetical protein